MGRHRSYTRQVVKERPWDVHPIWRGIGCVLIILIPIMAYAGAVLLIRQNNINNWVSLPPELNMTYVIAYLGFKINFSEVSATILLMFIGFGALVILYSFMYSLIGPSRYGPLDSPPIKRKPRKRR